mmetsp:Transcript_37967/g.56454  ORF Transcript_37967/g.56454 Transcript_37967/m.56454 type:complete len:249 (+) Transcript_37967:600-1346(+)
MVSVTGVIAFALLVALKGGGSLKPAAAASTSATAASPARGWPITIFTRSASHFIGSLATLLSKDYLNLTPTNRKAVHLVFGFSRHFGGCKLDESKALGLLSVEVSWDVNIANHANASKRLLQVFGAGVVWHVAHKERNTGWAFVTATSLAITTNFTTGRRPVPTSTTRPIVVVWRRTTVASIISVSVISVPSSTIVIRRRSVTRGRRSAVVVRAPIVIIVSRVAPTTSGRTRSASTMSAATAGRGIGS